MMLKLKCDYYLKLLKLLSFTLLISFSFGFVNFSSAVDFSSQGTETNPNTYWSGYINTEYLHGGYTYNVSNNLNFNTSISLLDGNLFYLEYISRMPSFFSIAWANNELYFVSRENEINIQGTLNNWYVGPVSERTNNSWYLLEKTFDVPTSAIIQARPDFKEYFFGAIGSTNNWVTNQDAYYICFSDYVNDYCVACNINSCPSGINTGNSLGITNINYDTLSAINWDSSPFVSSKNTSDVIFIYSGLQLTNSGMYQGLLNMGYYKDICYGDYNSGNYINSLSGLSQFFDGGDCEDSSSYCGMTLLEVYNSDLSGGVSWNYDSWFKNFYNIFKTSFNNNDLSWWDGKLKAKFKLMYKIYNNDFNSNFNATDYFTFCKMTSDIANGTFSGNFVYDSSIYPLTSNTSERIVQEKENAIQNDKFVLSGSEFSGANDLLGVFNQLYTSALNSFKVNSSLSNITGILPTYIVFGFFLFLLLYGLRR